MTMPRLVRLAGQPLALLIITAAALSGCTLEIEGGLANSGPDEEGAARVAAEGDLPETLEIVREGVVRRADFRAVSDCVAPELRSAIKRSSTTLPNGPELRDEDIGVYDPETGIFSVMFDGDGVAECVDACPGDPNDSCLAPIVNFGIRAGRAELPRSFEAADEDILTLDPNTSTYSVLIDGSDIGLNRRVEIDALAQDSDGSFIMSFSTAITLPGLVGGPEGERVDDSDLVRFVPERLGPDTVGIFHFLFDGSDVGLTSGGEDIDAVAILPDQRILISTSGSFAVEGAFGRNTDVLVFLPTSLGETTAGGWSMYLDGSDVGLTRGAANIDGLALSADGDLLATVSGRVRGLLADGDVQDEDVIRLTGAVFGDDSAGVWELFFDGSDHGLEKRDLGALLVGRVR